MFVDVLNTTIYGISRIQALHDVYRPNESSEYLGSL